MVTLVITLELEQVFQLVVMHAAVQDSLNLILFLTVDEFKAVYAMADTSFNNKGA
jgi:hypothetical protein